jgi:hypothetical protein
VGCPFPDGFADRFERYIEPPGDKLPFHFSEHFDEFATPATPVL